MTVLEPLLSCAPLFTLAAACAINRTLPRAEPPVPDRFRTGSDPRCPRPEFLVGTACTATLAEAEHQAAAQIAEQIEATVESDVISHSEATTVASGDARATEFCRVANATVHVRAHFDEVGLVRVVDSTSAPGRTCVLSCLSKSEAAEHERKQLADLSHPTKGVACPHGGDCALSCPPGTVCRAQGVTEGYGITVACENGSRIVRMLSEYGFNCWGSHLEDRCARHEQICASQESCAVAYTNDACSDTHYGCVKNGRLTVGCSGAPVTRE